MRCNICASVHVGMGFAWGKLGFTSVWAYVGPYRVQAPSTTRSTTQDKTQENKSLKGVDTINKGDIIDSTTTKTAVQNTVQTYSIRRDTT